MDSATGLNTPANVPRVRPLRSGFCMPNSTYPSLDCGVTGRAPSPPAPKNEPKVRNMFEAPPLRGAAMGAVSWSVLMLILVASSCWKSNLVATHTHTQMRKQSKVDNVADFVRPQLRQITGITWFVDALKRFDSFVCVPLALVF